MGEHGEKGERYKYLEGRHARRHVGIGHDVAEQDGNRGELLAKVAPCLDVWKSLHWKHALQRHTQPKRVLTRFQLPIPGIIGIRGCRV